MGEFDVSADTFFDTILDGGYRRTWDENVIEDYDICRLDDNNDVGYYSSELGALKFEGCWCKICDCISNQIGAVSFVILSITMRISVLLAEQLLLL